MESRIEILDRLAQKWSRNNPDCVIVDTFAEWLRMLKMYAPYRITDFFDISTVTEPILVGDVEPMLKDLYDSVELHIDNLIVAGDLANDAKEYGLANFFAERQTECQKMCWQMRVSMETEQY